MPSKYSLTLAAATAVVMAQAAVAAPITASDDSFVTDADFAAVTPPIRGASGKLSTLTTSSTTDARATVARFSLDSLVPGSTVGTSSVDFMVDGSTGLTGATAFTFSLYGVLNTALEDNLNDATYAASTNAASALDSSGNLIREANVFGGTPLANLNFTTAPSNGTTLSFSSAALETFLSGFTSGATDTDDDVAFALTVTATGNTTSRFDFTSTESATGNFVAPTLNVAVPEPTAALVLLAAGGFGLVRRRRA